MIAETTNNFTPLLTTVGFGGVAGFLIGLAIRYILKILAVIAGVFLTALIYLQSQGILNVNWGKLQTLFQPVLSNFANSTGATGHGATSIPTFIHSNLPFLPIDMGLPLAGSAGLGFILGLTRR